MKQTMYWGCEQFLFHIELQGDQKMLTVTMSGSEG